MTNCCHCSGVTPPPPPPSGACCSFDFTKASPGYGSDSWDLKSCENAVYQSDCDSRRHGKHFPGQECDDVWPEECGVDNRGYCCNGSVSGVEGIISVSGNNYAKWYDHPGGITFCGGRAGTEKVERLFFSPGDANCSSNYGEDRFSGKWTHRYAQIHSSETRVPYIINTDAIPEGRCFLNADESGVYFCLGPSEGVGNPNSSDSLTSKHEWENEITIGVQYDYFNLVETCDDPVCGTSESTTTTVPPTGSCCVLQEDKNSYQCFDGFTANDCYTYSTGPNIYRGGNSCADYACPPVKGVCCIGTLYSCPGGGGGSATCLKYDCVEDYTEEECDAASGFYNKWKAGEVCSEDGPCPPDGPFSTTTTTLGPCDDNCVRGASQITCCDPDGNQTTYSQNDGGPTYCFCCPEGDTLAIDGICTNAPRGCCGVGFTGECFNADPALCIVLGGVVLSVPCELAGSDPCASAPTTTPVPPTTTTATPDGACCGFNGFEWICTDGVAAIDCRGIEQAHYPGLTCGEVACESGGSTTTTAAPSTTTTASATTNPPDVGTTGGPPAGTTTTAAGTTTTAASTTTTAASTTTTAAGTTNPPSGGEGEGESPGGGGGYGP